MSLERINQFSRIHPRAPAANPESDLKKILKEKQMWTNEELKRVSYTSWKEKDTVIVQFARKVIGPDSVPFITKHIIDTKKLSGPDGWALINAQIRHNRVSIPTEHLRNLRETAEAAPSVIIEDTSKTEVQTPQTSTPSSLRKISNWFLSFFSEIALCIFSIWRRLGSKLS